MDLLTKYQYYILLVALVLHDSDSTDTDACRICICSSDGSRGYSVDCSYKLISGDDIPLFPNSSTKLLLQGNNLKKLKRSYFKNLSRLKYLDISFQIRGITSWDSDCFDDIKMLETLKIKGIKGTQVYPQPIVRLSNLRNLAITLRERPPYEYRHLTNITELDHSSPDCKFVSNYSAMSSLYQLRFLNLSDCALQTYSKGCLSYFKKLEILDISCNKWLGGYLFSWIIEDLQDTTLHTLYAEDISKSVPIQITDATLQHLNKSGINRIYIGSNQIHTYLYDYKPYRSLDYVSMDGYSFFKRNYKDITAQDVPVNVSKAFKHYVPLSLSGTGINTESLYLNGARLYIDDNCDFIHHKRPLKIVNYKKYDTAVNIQEYEKALQNADCCRNWRKLIAYDKLDKLFYSHVQYRHIRIENSNELLQLQQGSYVFKIPKFRDLCYSGKLCICFYLPMLNRAEFIKVSGLPLLIKIIGFQINLRFLAIESSNIKMVNKAFLSSAPNLVYLSAANNKLNETFNADMKEPDILSPLTQLEELNLSKNGISNLPVNIFINQTKLKKLILRHNLFEVWNICMSTLVSLTYLDLTGNFFKVVGQTSMDAFNLIDPDKFSLILDDNKIECSCLNLPMVTWIQQSKFIDERENLNCQNADNTPIVLFNPKSCEAKSINHAVTIGLASGIAATLIGIISFVFYKFHWLKYKFHIIKWRFRFLMNGMPVDAQLVNKEMIFISYENQDRNWVIKTLLPKLDKMQYNTYIHNRDFVVGRPIADNIVHAIDICAKTILVLSDRFSESEWCQFELQMALVKGADSVVPIQYSPIQKKNNTRLLRYLTKTKVYLDWCGRTISDDEFWNRLRYTLRKLKRNNNLLDYDPIELDRF